MEQDPGTEYVTNVGLRWSDFDLLGHLNQAVYHVLMEQARTAWLAQVYAGLDWTTQGFVLARVELDYRREVDTGHREVLATCQALKVGGASLTCRQEIRWLDGTVAASGLLVLVGWDNVARGKRQFGDAERAAFLS